MSTFRAEIAAGFTTMMNAFIALHPTMVARHFRTNPEAPKDLPYSYLSLRPENVAFSNGVRSRTITPSLVVVGQLVEAGQMADTFDATVDALVDFIGDYGGSFGGHITPRSVWSRMTVADGLEEIGESRFPAVRFSFPDLENVEGRGRIAVHVNPVTSTPESLTIALQAVGWITGLTPATMTAETLVIALVAAGLIVSGALNPVTSTPEAICLLLIANGLMEP